MSQVPNLTGCVMLQGRRKRRFLNLKKWCPASQGCGEAAHTVVLLSTKCQIYGLVGCLTCVSGSAPSLCGPWKKMSLTMCWGYTQVIDPFPMNYLNHLIRPQKGWFVVFVYMLHLFILCCHSDNSNLLAHSASLWDTLAIPWGSFVLPFWYSKAVIMFKMFLQW